MRSSSPSPKTPSKIRCCALLTVLCENAVEDQAIAFEAGKAPPWPAVSRLTRETECVTLLRMTLTPKQAKAIRDRLDMTQAALAQTLNVSTTTIRHWEHGRRSCSGTAEAMLRLLDAQAKGKD